MGSLVTVIGKLTGAGIVLSLSLLRGLAQLIEQAVAPNDGRFESFTPDISQTQQPPHLSWVRRLCFVCYLVIGVTVKSTGCPPMVPVTL